jgi:hypothetical protein
LGVNSVNWERAWERIGTNELAVEPEGLKGNVVREIVSAVFRNSCNDCRGGGSFVVFVV